jgi:hypothetical protein
MNFMMEGVPSTIGSSLLFNDFPVWNQRNFYSVGKDHVLDRLKLQLKRPILLHDFSKMDSVNTSIVILMPVSKVVSSF